MKPITTSIVSAICSCVFAACGATGIVTPAAPTAVSNPTATPVPPATAIGNIRFAAVTHDSGGALRVQDCAAFSPISANHLCNEEWHAAFDVTSTVDLMNGALSVYFEHAGMRCGEVWASSQSFAAGRERLVGTSNPVFVTRQLESGIVELPCPLPVTTDRLVVQLWDPRRPVAPLLRREFDYVFTFVE